MKSGETQGPRLTCGGDEMAAKGRATMDPKVVKEPQERRAAVLDLSAGHCRAIYEECQTLRKGLYGLPFPVVGRHTR